MKKTLILVILFIAIGSLISACSTASPPLISSPTLTPPATSAPTPTFSDLDVEVIYYDLSGFVLIIGEKKIMIDTLFAGYSGHAPPQPAFDLMIAGEPPFDQIDLVLTTHTDVDHFSARVMNSYLQNYPETILVSTFQVVEQLVQENPDLVNPIYSVDIQPGETQVISLDGIEIECLYISHGDPNLLNLGFVVSVDGISIFHSGDLAAGEVTVDDLLAYRLPDRDLDIALVVYHLLRYDVYNQHLTEGIQAKYIIPTHYEYDHSPRPFEAFPEAIIFTDSMQTWQMP